jgi:hypothetical protein
MNGPLLVIGILLAAAGAILLAFIRVYSESARRENRRIRNLEHRAADAGLRGRFTFERDPAKWGSVGAFGTYEPVDDEDRALFAVVGPRIEAEASFFAGEMLWTDYHLSWLGVPLLLIGAATCAVAVFS